MEDEFEIKTESKPPGECLKSSPKVEESVEEVEFFSIKCEPCDKDEVEEIELAEDHEAVVEEKFIVGIPSDLEMVHSSGSTDRIPDLNQGQRRTRDQIQTSSWPIHSSEDLECEVELNEGIHILSKVTKYSNDTTCTQCGKSFSNRFSLRRHIQIHTGEWNFPCPECGKIYGDKENLKAHIVSHTDAQLFACEECGRQFPTERRLKNHVTIHTNIKPHPCPHCGKSFRHRGNLNMHILTHTKEKNYFCMQCGMAFLRKDKLTRHFLTHSEVRHHSCGQCGKSYKHKECLKKHMLQHT